MSMKKYMKSVLLTAVMALGMLSFAAYAQDNGDMVNIKGRVFNSATGDPVDGAKVSMGTAFVYTLDDGTFVLKVKNPTSILRVSANGFDRGDVEWRGRDSVMVYLSAAEFSTPMGYRPQVDPADMTLLSRGAATKTVEDLDLLSPIETVESVLLDRMGDIRITRRSGKEGIGANMYVRGFNSINSHSQPLIIVDGIITETYLDLESIHDGFKANYLLNIDLKDIENITVIKDATSLYGAKAANGVILIETVRGHDPVTRILANASAGITLPYQTLPMLDAEQSRVLASEMFAGTSYTMAEVDNMALFNDDPNYLYYNQYHNETDWSDWVFQNAFSQSYGARATGGDQVGMYALSVGFLTNQGILDGNTMNHLNFRFNSDISISKTINLPVDFAVSSVQYNLNNDGVSATAPAYQAAIKSPMFYPYSYSRVKNDNGIYPVTSEMEDYDILLVNNPVSILNLAEQSSKQTTFTASARPKWDINQHMSLKGTAAYALNKFYESYFTPILGVAPRVEFSSGGYTQRYLNEAKSQSMRDIRNTFELTYDYHNSFGGNSLKAMAGWRYMKEFRVWDLVGGYNTGEDNQTFVKADLSYKFMDGEDRTVKNLSYFANADWNYLEKYYLNATVSMNASSRFGKNIDGALNLFGVNWAVFPSMTAAWLVSAEDFMADLNMLDMLKLRASYGLTGNDDIEDYLSYAYFVSSNYYGNLNGLVLGNLGNTRLKWETTTKANFGVDLSLFRNRFSVSADVFSHRTKDLLALKALNPIAGFDSYWANDGELTNKGYDVSANLRLIDTKNFRWEASVSAAHYKNEIVSLANGDYLTDLYDGQILTAVGGPIGQFYGLKAIKVLKNDAEASTANYLGNDYVYLVGEDTSKKPFTAGNMLFEDVNKDGFIDEHDKQVIGDPNPDLTGMLSSKISYKGVSLTAMFNYSLGNDVYNYYRRQLESLSGFDNQTIATLNRWRSEKQQTVTMPKATYGDPMGNSTFSSRWIEDGSFLRLSSLKLAWDVPYKIPNINGLTIWAAANNLALWTHYLGLDPETSISTNVLCQGIDAGLQPQCQSFMFGLKFNL